jgi:small-conductance mechanosensitive channel
MNTSTLTGILILLLHAAVITAQQSPSIDTLEGTDSSLVMDSMPGKVPTSDTFPIESLQMHDSVIGWTDTLEFQDSLAADSPPGQMVDTAEVDIGMIQDKAGEALIETVPVTAPAVSQASSILKEDPVDKMPAIADSFPDKQTVNSLVTGSSTDSLAGRPQLESIDPSRKITQIGEFVSFSKIFWSIVLILINILGLRLIFRLLHFFADRNARLRFMVKAFIAVFRIIAWSIVVYIIIQVIFKPNWQTILALSASIGVAVGFAAQDFLKNIFGGFTIIAEKSFQVGDKIQAGEHYGEVLSIGFRSSKIVTADDSVVTIPNAELTAEPVSNSNIGKTNCQVVAEFYLPERIDFDNVRRIATEAAQISGFVFLNKPISVLFSHEREKETSYIKMRLKAYVLDVRYEFAFKSQMTEIVLQELRKEKII